MNVEKIENVEQFEMVWYFKEVEKVVSILKKTRNVVKKSKKCRYLIAKNGAKRCNFKKVKNYPK